ncbi:AfsR/SARP family transcriptional regulator [Amycolatopsis sp. NBC_01480]|uniref:AfsR/SARP family transcriptional regulator n=1 Tax=Amycolatopsis sp. NBC_01480 TaxID=2903562 RepID=UPI002E2AAA18|nr:BTAD domain-containing putative transcriptional regulator [Amycolatopsis sp. NBC_01480]
MLRLLGEVSADGDGRFLDLGPARQRCVFAALAVDADRLVPLERLAERVWGAEPPPRARAAVHSYVSRLRQALSGAGVSLTRRTGGHVLETSPTVDVDLRLFRELAARGRGETGDAEAARLLTEALALWRGEALAGLTGGWAETERERLGRERLAAEHELAEVRLRLGHGRELVPELAARAAEHPLDERVAGQYLLALDQAGRGPDALDHYRRVRARLIDELGTEPGDALQGIHRRLLAAPDPTPRPAAVLRQLPATPASFVGRDRELAELDTAGAVTAIAGAGGIGKTWLALRWAARNAGRFPDGQLFVDLRGFAPDEEPLDPAEVVRGFLEDLGVEPRRMPAATHSRAALFRSLVAGKRLLLMLDNALDTGQVRPLLPGGGTCTVLVTSRNQLPGLLARHAARHLPLDALSGAEARALLIDRLGAARVAAEMPAVDQLIALCGGFPLALALTAANACTRPGLPLAVLADELADRGLAALADDDPSASLPAVLSWSYRSFAPAEVTAFALLGIAPGPDIGLPAAACLTGLSPGAAAAALARLTGASLVVEDATGRYRMHDLVRRHAADLAHELPEDVRDAAVRRVVDFLLHTAHGADQWLNPHRPGVALDPSEVEPLALPDAAAALAWFDTEHACLIAAQGTTAARGWHRATWNLAWTLTTYQQRRGHIHKRLAVWLAGLAAAEHLGDRSIASRTHRFLGRAYTNLQRHDKAIEHLDRAVALAERHGDDLNQARAHFELARAWEQQQGDAKAVKHAKHALRLHRVIGDAVWEARSLNQVGWYSARFGDYEQARAHCEAALALHRALDDPEAEAHTLDSLGYIAHHAGRPATAVEHYEQAVHLFRGLGEAYQEADTLAALGNSYRALGRGDSARSVWQQAAEQYRDQGRHDDAKRIRRDLAALDRSGPPER